jgi:hypothetical protein
MVDDDRISGWYVVATGRVWGLSPADADVAALKGSAVAAGDDVGRLDKMLTQPDAT